MATISGSFGGTARSAALTVNPASNGTLPPPSQVTPATDARFNRGQTIVFDWSDVAGAASYAVQIDDQSSFASPIVNQNVSTSTFSTSTLPATRMWWRASSDRCLASPVRSAPSLEVRWRSPTHHYLTFSSSRHNPTSVISNHDPQLLKGVVSLLLLQLVAERESYGYEVVQRLHALGFVDVLEGTVYPALARLEREGRVHARLVPSSAGPARKYYRPTPAGYEALAAGAASWSSLVAVVDAVLSNPVPADPEIGA